MELIRQVALGPDRVAVIVTHDPRVFGFADRIVTLEDGRVAGETRGERAAAAAGSISKKGSEHES